MVKLEDITNYVSAIETIKIIRPFKYEGPIIRGQVLSLFSNCNLSFEVEIYPQYPFQFEEKETIRFINKDLIEFNHVMADGAICIHTLHSPDARRKIEFDFYSLKVWITKYYLNKENDTHYEHIIVPEKSINGINTFFLFTDVDFKFNKGDYGVFRYSTIADCKFNSEKGITNIVNSFILKGTSTELFCKWSDYYKNAFPLNEGIFYYSDVPPVANKRFAVANWTDLEPFCSEEFLYHLYWMNVIGFEAKQKEIPLMIGYKISETEIHWQTILIDMKHYPCYGEKIRGKTLRKGSFYNAEIPWARTRNCSQEYFFGRGMLHKKFSDANILILGIGAIGSMISTTLARGGCKNLTVIDYDIKEPENICRSEYLFSSGLADKIGDISKLLTNISPFINVRLNSVLTDGMKSFEIKTTHKDDLIKYFSQYDIIFDCTTDNDLAFLLDQIEYKGTNFNFSITNHAKELVCVTGSNTYKWVMEIFEKLNNDVINLYNPTGCWSPTFRASYNDIASLVQFAIKHLNLCYEKEISIRSFYLSTSFDQGFNIKVNQF